MTKPRAEGFMAVPPFGMVATYSIVTSPCWRCLGLGAVSFIGILSLSDRDRRPRLIRVAIRAPVQRLLDRLAVGMHAFDVEHADRWVAHLEAGPLAAVLQVERQQFVLALLVNDLRVQLFADALDAHLAHQLAPDFGVLLFQQ